MSTYNDHESNKPAVVVGVQEMEADVLLEAHDMACVTPNENASAAEPTTPPNLAPKQWNPITSLDDVPDCFVTPRGRAVADAEFKQQQNWWRGPPPLRRPLPEKNSGWMHITTTPTIAAGGGASTTRASLMMPSLDGREVITKEHLSVEVSEKHDSPQRKNSANPPPTPRLRPRLSRRTMFSSPSPLQQGQREDGLYPKMDSVSDKKDLPLTAFSDCFCPTSSSSNDSGLVFVSELNWDHPSIPKPSPRSFGEQRVVYSSRLSPARLFFPTSSSAFHPPMESSSSSSPRGVLPSHERQ